MRGLRSPVSLVLSLALLGVVSQVAVAASEPTLWSPYPGVLFFMLGVGWPRWTLTFAAWGLFWSVSLLVRWFNRRTLPLKALLALLTFATLGYFALNVPEGLVHQGAVHVAFVGLMNILSLGLLWQRQSVECEPGSGASLLSVPLLISLWTFSFAFPYFGEGI